MDRDNIKKNFFFYYNAVKQRNQLQKEKWEKNKYVETKQHICGDQTICYYKMNRSMKKLENTSRHMKIETKRP